VDDQNQTTSTAVNNGSGEQSLQDINIASEPLDTGTEALSLDPSTLGKPPPDGYAAEGLKSRNPFAKIKMFKRADVVVVLLLVVGMTALLINAQVNKNKQKAAVSNVTVQYGTQHIPLNGFLVDQAGGISFGPSDVTINGLLNVTDSMVLAPSVQPNAPTSGQLYFDQNTNQMAYYNGTKFIAITEQGATVQSIGGATGAISLGGGLSVVNNQLTAALPSGVSSVGGVSGAITVGNGLKIVGSDIQNSGVISVVAGTPNLVVGNDGNGNVTISSVGGGSGTVTSTGGTSGRIAKFTGVQNVEDSLLSDDGTTVTANGNLSVTGSLLLSTLLPVASGGTGANNFPANGVVIGHGTAALTGVTAPSPGLCLISTAGAPSFQACNGSGTVTSVNGLDGALTIANATGSVNTITIDDASATAKGIASFNATNFTVVGGSVNTAQNISPSSTPTFSGVNTNNITPSSALTIGSAAQTLSLLGSASSVFSVTGGGQTTNLGFSGAPTGTVNYNLDRSATPGTYTICTTANNCSGGSGGVTTLGGTTDRLSKFTGGQTIGDSSLSDNGSVVTVNGTANLVVQGGTGTFGTLTQAGTLAISDGSSNTVSIVATGMAADRVYTLPDAGGSATFCLDTGNCIGGGSGGAPNTATYLVASLSGTLSNERALTGGANISLTDGGANGNMTVATVQNPTFTTSVTTPVLQSSGALTITSAAGQVIAIDAGTTIELQDSTNVTGNLDVSATFTAGTANAFQVNGAGAIAAATGITSSGTIIFSGLNCTAFANGGALTTNGSGQLTCSDDDGGSGGAISGSGTSGKIPVFTGAQTIADSIITQTGTTINIAGNLTLTTALSVANGGTGVQSLTARGLLYGNGVGAVGVTAAGTSGQVLVADGSGIPTFVSFSGDVAVSNTGATTIQADSVALGTDTTGNYVASLGTVTGLNISGNTGEGSTPNLSVAYGAIANTAVQGNVTLGCASGTGNLNGGGNTITLGTGGNCNNIGIVSNPDFAVSVRTPSMILSGGGSDGAIQVGTLGQGTVYTLPDPGAGAATICISTGNCPASGPAGGDLTGTYPNPTIAKLQGTNLSITSPAAGNILVYNATSGAWVNQAITGDIAISETGVSTVQANSVALGTDTTGNYVLGLSAGNGISVTGSAGEGWSPTVNVVYGSAANTAVQGNVSLTVTAGTNLTGGGAITLGTGGTVTLNVASSPTFSGTLTVQGATATVGTSSQQGSVVLNDGSSNTGTIQTAPLGQNTTFTLPDPGAGSATICLTTGNCAGSGGGVTTGGGTTNRISKFTGSQTIGDSSVSDDGTTVTVNGTANLVVQGGTGTFGTLTQSGTLAISDGSGNTVSIVTSPLSADRVYTLPDAGGNATLCVNSGNCIGGTGSAPNAAAYLVASLDGTLTDERVLANGSNISITDGGANGSMTVATVQNPTFTTSVTTPVLQSSGALTITSAGGQIIAIDAGTTIELQDSTNVTGSLDVSAAFTAGTANAFQVNASGVITSAAGITSSGTITFSGLNCTTFTNGGALTTNASGQLTCSNDDGGAGGAVSGTGTNGTIPVFTGTNTIADSIVTQSGTTITVAGDLTLTTALSVANGGTGAQTLTSHGVLFGNGTAAVGVTSAGTGGQVLIANASGVPTFASFTGDVAVSNTGGTTIQANSVALGTDTTGNYVNSLGTLTGLSTTGNTGEGSTPTLSVNYGAIANTAVQGNVTLTCPSGTGNLTGGGTVITLGTGGTCGALNIIDNPTFATSVTTPLMILSGAGSSGTVQVANLGQGTVYTLPDPGAGAATICISTGNCSAAGTAGGDLTGTYPNPTIAKLQNTNLTITSPTAGHILVYNGTNGAWENHALTGDIAISETGVSSVQANAVALGTDTTGNYVLGLTAGNGVSITGTAGEGWSPTVNVVYGSAANTAVQGNVSLTVTAGTNLTGGGAITLGTGGTVTLNVASSPTFSGTLTVQGATATIGGAAQQGSVVLNDGSANTGTLQTAPLGQNTVFTLPDPGVGTATICLTTGNCAGTGSGVTTTGGTTNRVSKFTGSQSLGDSTISDNGTLVTINGTANFVVQGGTATLGTLTQAGTLAVSDGSSNTVSIVSDALAADRVYTLPDAGGNATFCMDSGNCVGGGSGGAPNTATYLVTSLNGTLTNERAITNGANISLTDGGANGSFTVATVQNPTFTTSVTTPILQSSGGLTITSAAGTTVAIDAGTTIELQDSTNVTGSLDVSVALNVGTANAFQVSSGGAIAAATGITTSGTVTFSGLNCTSFANGGTLTTNGSGVLSCADDDGGSGSAITGAGVSGTIPVFNGTQTITNSIITQSGTTISIAGDLTLTTALSVANGGTGTQTLTSHGVLFGNGTAAVGVTAAGTGGQVLIANASGIPTFASFTGDVAVSNTGATTIQANSVALGTDTTGNYIATLGTLTGLGTTGNTGEGSTPTLSVTYGSSASTAVQGNTLLNCPSGSGNLTGGGTAITLGTGGTCSALSTINNPTFTTSVTTPLLALTGAGSTGQIQVATLGQPTTYTLPDPGVGGAANICLSTGNCATAGTAGGDLTGTYPNPTIAKLQGGTLTITSPASSNLLMYNGSAWVNQSMSNDVTLSSTGVATIATGAVTSGKIADGTIANIDLTTGSFTNITGVGTLSSLTVTGATNINTSGSAGTSIGNASATFQLASTALNISSVGALTGVSGITTTGGYTQSGATANTLTGATTLSAAGTALSVTNNATIGGALTVNSITPNSALTVGVAGQSFTLQGNGTSAIKATDTGNTTTLDFTTPTANTTLHLPALAAGAYTLCTSSGNCAGVGVTLQTAYTNSTATEIVLDATRGALTVRDTSGGLGANLLEVQNNLGSTTYFNVTAAGVNITGTNTTSGNVNTTGGAIQTNTVDRISNGGNLVNIGTVTTSGAINSQTISSTANFTGTVTIQGANALNLGVTGTSTGAILFKGATAASGTITLIGPANPTTNTITLPNAAGTICLQSSASCNFAATTGGTGYIQNQSASQQAASSFWISSTGRIDGGLTTNNVTSSSGSLILQAATNVISLGGSDSLTANGGFSIFTGTNGSLSVAANGTGTLSLGDNGTAGRVINIAATGSQATTSTTNIGTSTGAAQTVNIGSTNGASAMTLQAGSGSLALISSGGSINLGSVGSSTASSTVHIADTTSATGTQLVTIGSAAANVANITTIQGGTANGVGAGGIRLNAPVVALTSGSARLDVGDTGTVSAQTYRSADQTAASTASAAVAYTTGQVSGATSTSGSVTLRSGHSTTSGDTGAVSITSGTATSGNSGSINLTVGSATGSVGQINIGDQTQSVGTKRIDIGSVDNAGTTIVNIATAASDSDLSLGSSNATSSIIMEAGTSASSLQIGNGATAHGIQIGTSASAVQTIVVGSTNGASTTTLQAGTGGIVMNTPSLIVTGASKGYRIRDSGGSIDMESSGAGVAGELWMSGWTAAGFTGTQVNFFRMSQTSRIIMVGTGSTTATPMQIVLDNSSAVGDPGIFNGGMYYSTTADRMRCAENGVWKNCIGSAIATGGSTTALPGAINTTSATYANVTGSSLAFTKQNADTNLVVTINGSFFIGTGTITTVRFGVNIGGTDYDCGTLFENDTSKHRGVTCTVTIPSVTAGAKTAQVRWKRQAGTGTVNADTNDWFMINVLETD
jgi:hypothetical protein